ncbi:MAG: nitrate reductase subunit beta [Geobacteraceae bacterium]|nr:nitrate reductase subunit beta [Geobacteraceae bacterium]
MKVRAQTSMVFHLDKCIGCHTCSIACKNIWTDRPGCEYMWWNNVETKPGTGYPTLWEDQEKYRGGWELRGKRVRLRLHGRAEGLANIFYNPFLPSLDDYYEPWSYRYGDLADAPSGKDQPVARPVSMITGREAKIEAGPNWDDDLGGSGIYAAGDINLAALTAGERRQLFSLERLVFFHLPRICNHCLNPGCVAACPTGAIYKRGEDGIVLVNQEKCRAWRMCVSGCPYKKVYYNWGTGKSEKCILCYPRQETGQAPACFHSCVGRIRYLGVLLYDADRIREMAARPDHDLVEAQLGLILDPSDREVLAQAREDGVHESLLEAARRSPVYRFVKEWRLALPLHPGFRTLPMLFYVPPLLPVAAAVEGDRYDLGGDLFGDPATGRLPIRYFAALLAAGNEEPVKAAYRKLLAVRLHRRSETVGDVAPEVLAKALATAGSCAGEAEAIYRLSALAGFDERHVVPPFLREMAIEATADPLQRKEETGTGFTRPPKRGW